MFVTPSHFRFERRHLSIVYVAFYTSAVAVAVAVEVAVLNFLSTIPLFDIGAFRTATIEGDAGGVTMRSFFQTRRQRCDEEARVHGLSCRTGLCGRHGAIPVLQLSDGRRVRLGEFCLPTSARELDPARKAPLALAQHFGPQMSLSAHDPVWPFPSSVSIRG